MNEANQSPEPAPDWEQLRPLLDDLVDELGAGDREAVLLRYFENRPLAEVGTRLRLSEEGARSRVDRAVAKLRTLLDRRGIKSSGAALGLALGQQASGAAPAGLAASVTGVALSGMATGAGASALGFFGFMTTAKFATTVSLVAAVAGLGTAYLGANAVRETRTALAGSTTAEQALTAKLTALETRVNEETRRQQAADENYQKLMGAVRQSMTAGGSTATAESEPITSEVVDRRFKRALNLLHGGDPAEALQELLWCYDVGMQRIAGMGAQRMISLNFIADLGTRHPPALAALRVRREKARQTMLASQQELAATQEFAAINNAIKDDQANLTLIAQFPAGDERRATLAAIAYEALVENRRYHEALEGRSFGELASSFELGSNRELPANQKTSDTFAEETRRDFIAETARDIEVLAGAGQIDRARTLANRLLAYDSTESTRSLVQKHAERAGQPALLSAPATR